MQRGRWEVKGEDKGNGLYGLKGMSSDVPEVRGILSALASKVQGCW